MYSAFFTFYCTTKQYKCVPIDSPEHLQIEVISEAEEFKVLAPQEKNFAFDYFFEQSTAEKSERSKAEQEGVEEKEEEEEEREEDWFEITQ